MIGDELVEERTLLCGCIVNFREIILPGHEGVCRVEEVTYPLSDYYLEVVDSIKILKRNK